jgi:hypothetical protein
VDFIYINRDGENEELRYSIRSVVDNVLDANIWVVGGKPDWYVGNFVPVENVGNKFKNITECYKAICNIAEVSDFIAMNDDFFILEQMSDIPYLYDGLLIDKAELHGSLHGTTEYFRVLTQANKALISMGINQPLNYDIHTPIKMNKEKLAKIVDLSYAPRSLYGNIFNVGGREIQDVKVYRNTPEDKIFEYFISTEDNTFDVVYTKLLKDKFNTPSKYER